MKTPIRREVISEKVAYSIIDIIVNQSMKEGDKLPTERDLSVKFAVGRPAIREALRALYLMNIIDIRHGDGIYVSSLEPQNLINPFKIYMKLGKVTIEQLFEIRIMLETEGIGLAAKRISEEQLDELDRIIIESKENIDSSIRFLEIDTKLHNIIFDATNNPLLKSIMLSIKDLTRKSREITGDFAETREIVYEDHIKLVNALKNRDEELCKKEMKAHLLNVKNIAMINEDIYRSRFLELFNKS